jgi:DNA-binding NarL/FixJ family response regulator
MEAAGSMSVRLLVVDDQEVMRAGLRTVTARSEIEVAKEVSTDDKPSRHVAKANPDVCLIDVGFATGRGFAALDELHQAYPELPKIMWSCHDNPTYVARANALGARGFLLHSASGVEIVEAIRAVAAGGTAWVLEHHRKIVVAVAGAIELPAVLTPREIDVLRQLAYGLSNREIAKVLKISYETVKEHVQHILGKLNMTDRTQAAVWAVRQGLG